MVSTPAETAIPPWETCSDEALLEVLGGNADAAQFCRDISFISHIYDDLIDGDKPVPAEHIHALIWKTMLALPANPFYRANEAMLRPLLVTGILNWRAANQMEQSGCTEQLHIAHAIRYGIADAVLMSVALTRGQDYAAQHASRIRLMLQADTWAHYSKEHHHA